MENKMNKRGWIKIVEAVIAIILLATIVLIVVNTGRSKGSGLEEVIYNIELSKLREIELSSTLRAEVIATSGEVELAAFPSGTKAKIEADIPSYLTCDAKICDPVDSCLSSQNQAGDVYVNSVMISADLSTFNSRVLKMFCWET